MQQEPQGLTWSYDKNILNYEEADFHYGNLYALMSPPDPNLTYLRWCAGDVVVNRVHPKNWSF